MIVLKNCCFCCSLETGGMILGWFGAVKSIVAIVVLSVFLYKGTFDYSHGDQFIAISSVVLALCFIILLSSILLIVGTASRKPVLLLPWLITEMVAIVGLGLTQFFILPSLIAGVAFGIAINVYFWICVLALYQHLQTEENLLRSHRTDSDWNLPAYTHIK